MENKNNKQGLFKITSGIMIGVVTLLGYLFMGARNETFELQKSLTTKVEELSSTQIKLDSIIHTLDNKMAEIIQLGGNIAELQTIKKSVESDKAKLKSDLSFSVKKYSIKIREYEKFLTLKDKDISKLKEEYDRLLVLNEALKAEKQEIVDENTGLRFEKETLRSAVAEYSAQNEDLRRKVNLAAAMKAINVQVTALSSKGRERDGGAYRASRIYRLKVSFMLPSNPLAARNNKDIYVRIIDSNGGVVNEAARPGTFWFEGRELGYSTHQIVPFENNDQKVDIIYGKGNAYQPGKYSVELYTEGFKIGNGQFVVN
ncbi:hypothetical protein GVN16_06195 [Emticicia sp. CRIBPO]|uniref:hypothetical protein n=1 Tax=Emticicia sp. CRIBPO TaxID=2683258 RepID=UPI001412E53C|nr:hypothetical protein [Emticicia sp. CRIBPO]NBA85343.1 hypothetical protein [Emticicia sp. CRIBPO]